MYVPPQTAHFGRVHIPAPLPLLGLWGHFSRSILRFFPGEQYTGIATASPGSRPTRATLQDALLCCPGWEGES